MPKYDHPDVLDGGPLAIKNGATKMVLLKNYAFGDSYATVSGNIVAGVTMTSTEYTLSTSGNDRVLTVAAGKTATATAAALAAGNGQDHHFAHLDVAGSRVLWVTDETGESANAVGDTITFPSHTRTSKQSI